MLPAGKDTCWRSTARGMLQAATPGTLFIDSSTIDVALGAWRPQARRATPRCCRSTRRCRAASAVRRRRRSPSWPAAARRPSSKAKPILEAMGKRVVHCGEAGAGQAAKICNNMMLGISMIGVCEAFVLAEKLGLSHQALFDVASTSSGQCWSLTSYCPVPGPVPERALQQQLQGGLRLRADAEGPEAGAGGRRQPPAPPRRWAPPRRSSTACTTPGARAARTSPASSI